jgi:hypothetical protein
MYLMPWQSAHFAGSRLPSLSLSTLWCGAERTDSSECVYFGSEFQQQRRKKLSFYDPRCLLWRSTCSLLNASSMIMMMMAKHEPTASASASRQFNLILFIGFDALSSSGERELIFKLLFAGVRLCYLPKRIEKKVFIMEKKCSRSRHSSEDVCLRPP